MKYYTPDPSYRVHSWMGDYTWTYNEFAKDPEKFWDHIAKKLHWFSPYDKVSEWNYPYASWTATSFTFAVSGNYTYAEEGTYPVSVTITYNDNAANPVTVQNTTIKVADAPLTAVAALASQIPSVTAGVELRRRRLRRGVGPVRRQSTWTHLYGWAPECSGH